MTYELSYALHLSTAYGIHHQFNLGHNKKNELSLFDIRIQHIMHIVINVCLKVKLHFILYHS